MTPDEKIENDNGTVVSRQRDAERIERDAHR